MPWATIAIVYLLESAPISNVASSRKTQRIKETSERALELVKARSPAEWNKWRKEYNLFGDHVDARIDLSKANLRRSNLRDYVLTNVNFSNSDLSNAQLTGCDCTSGSFHLSTLVAANLRTTCFRAANLSRAYLRGAILDEADLRGADLRRASLTGASMTDTDIRGVDLRGTRGVSQEQLEESIGDINTLLPGHLRHPSHWTKYVHTPADEPEEEGAVPRPVPATVDVSMEVGRLTLAMDAGDALFTTSFNDDDLRSEIIDDIESILPRLSNTVELSKAASKYLSALRQNLNIIIIGMRGEHLTAQVRRMAQIRDGSESLLPDVIGALNGIIVQHFLYVNQSHKWRSFVEEASRSRFASDDFNRSIAHAQGLQEVLLAHPNAADPAVPDALRAAAEEVRQGHADLRLVIFNLYAGINNVLKVLTSWAVKEFKRIGGKSWNLFGDALSSRLGRAGAALLTATSSWFIASKLADRWPEYFGWFRFFVDLIRSTG